MFDYDKISEVNIRKVISLISTEDNLKSLLEQAYEQGWDDCLEECNEELMKLDGD